VSSSMFQALGNTVPSLVASVVRLLIVAVPAFILARRPDFRLEWVWYLSAGSILVQVVLSLVLLQRAFRRRFGRAHVTPAG